MKNSTQFYNSMRNMVYLLKYVLFKYGATHWLLLSIRSGEQMSEPVRMYEI